MSTAIFKLSWSAFRLAPLIGGLLVLQMLFISGNVEGIDYNIGDLDSEIDGVELISVIAFDPCRLTHVPIVLILTCVS